MTRLSFVLLAAFALSIAVIAQERIALTVPEALPTNQNYRIERVTLTDDDPGTAADEGTIFIQLAGVERAASVNCLYSAATSPTGSFLIVALNKANLSAAYAGNGTTGSLKQRINHRLVVMGESTAVCGKTLTGSLTGSPQ